MGYPVVLLRRAAGSVTVKHNVKTTMYPNTTLMPTPHSIALGSVSDAFLISSAIMKV